MGIQPFVVLFRQVLRVYEPRILLDNFHEPTKLVLKPSPVLRTNNISLWIFKQLDILLGPEPQDINIPGQILHHLHPQTLLFLRIRVQQKCYYDPVLPVLMTIAIKLLLEQLL